MRKLPLLLAVGQLAIDSIGSVGIARAQSPPRGAPSPAQRLREQGSAEANAGRLPEALAAWRAAWALSPDNRSLACDIGRGELLSGHDVEAVRWMSRCVRLTRDGGTPRGVERRRAEVVDLAVARSRVAEISLAVEDGAALLLDGKSLGAAPLGEPLFVEPGRHRLEARKGTRTASATVDAVAGQEHRVSLAFKVEPPPFVAPETKQPKEAPRAPLPPVAPLGRSPQDFVWWPVVTGAALTVATVGGGAASWLVGSMAHDQADLIQARILADTSGKGCGKLSNHPECEAFGAADRRRVAFINAATGLFIAGGIVAAATLGYTAYEKDRVSVSITAGGAVGRYAW
jgi:hypothetical protein